MADYSEHHFTAQDGTRIYYRRYGRRGGSALPVLCIGGLTRNSKDFNKLATRLGQDRLVLCPDYRGRGQSGRADYTTYAPGSHVSDIMHLLTIEGIHRVVVIGTSLGGLMAMALSVAMPSALAGLVINDVGPDISADGQARILAYVGVDQRHATLEDAAQSMRETYGRAFPDWTDADWLTNADGTYAYDAAAGNWRLDYDLALRDALAEQARSTSRPDLWALFKGLKHIPAVLVHGALSDVLKAETVSRMQAAKPDLELITLENRGHAPSMTEPGCLPRLLAFVEECDAHAGH
ncbi:MAG: alpha/beta hydrolase [Minwuia sp.]|nr:alpha/beta hydrolase [Minwuia sp.]